MSPCACDGGPHPETTIHDEVAMLRQLYSVGFGYNKIADLLRLPHEAVRDFLSAGGPEFQASYLKKHPMTGIDWKAALVKLCMWLDDSRRIVPWHEVIRPDSIEYAEIMKEYPRPRVRWDGKNFAAVQELMNRVRKNGEPPYAIPLGDMTRLQVRTGPEEWTHVEVGQYITLARDNTISVTEH